MEKRLSGGDQDRRQFLAPGLGELPVGTKHLAGGQPASGGGGPSVLKVWQLQLESRP